jgi:hypothetical protein
VEQEIFLLHLLTEIDPVSETFCFEDAQDSKNIHNNRRK